MSTIGNMTDGFLFDGLDVKSKKVVIQSEPESQTEELKDWGRNFWGDNYTGNNNPPNYQLPPKNYRDFVSKFHDKWYDNVHAAGLKGVLTSREAIPADITFTILVGTDGTNSLLSGISKNNSALHKPDK